MKTYREYVIQALEVLEKSHNNMCVELLNLASTGEMEHVMSAFEVGDAYEFELGHFEGCEDSNLRKLIGLMKNIDNTYQQLKAENNILSEEIFPGNYYRD